MTYDRLIDDAPVSDRYKPWETTSTKSPIFHLFAQT
jgi:hypothetical protein